MSCSVATDGASNDEVTPEVRCSVQGEDCARGAAGGCDGSGAGQAARGASEPDLRLEEAGRGQYGEPVCPGRQRVGGRGGGARAGDCQALQQDWRTDGGAGFLGQEAKSMSAPARRAKVERSGAELSVRRQCQLLNVARSG